MAVFIISFFLAFRHTVTPFTVHGFRKVHVIDAQDIYIYYRHVLGLLLRLVKLEFHRLMSDGRCILSAFENSIFKLGKQYI